MPLSVSAFFYPVSLEHQISRTPENSSLFTYDIMHQPDLRSYSPDEGRLGVFSTPGDPFINDLLVKSPDPTDPN